MSGKIVLIGVLGLLVIIGGIVGSWAYRFYTAPIEGKVGAQEQIQSSGSRIAGYNHFFDLYAAIQAFDASIKAQEDQLSQVTTTSERERILANLAGNKAARARAVIQYNADAQKSYTIGQFRSWSLPYQVEQ